jgi:hypothetical protein
MWVADLRDTPPTRLWRCECAKGRCQYHSADWPLLLQVVLEEFKAAYGDGPAALGTASKDLWPEIASRLPHRRHRTELAFAYSLFDDPMLATREQWTNGQHRCQAAKDAGCHLVLFAR